MSGLKAASVVLSPDISQRPAMMNSKPMMMRVYKLLSYSLEGMGMLCFSSLFSISDILYKSFLIVDRSLLPSLPFRIIDRHPPYQVNR